MSFLGSLQQLDGFVRARSEGIVRQRTTCGALLTLVAGVLMSMLFFSEVGEYMSTKIENHVGVDYRLSASEPDVQLSMSIDFLDLECGKVTLGVRDSKGHFYGEAAVALQKTPLPAGTPVHGHFIGLGPRTERVGCRVQGELTVHKVSGTIDVVPSSFQPGRFDAFMGIPPSSDDKFNASHVIRKFQVGKQVAGIPQPLNGVIKSSDQLSQFRYFITVVPTTYVHRSGFSESDTYQIAVSDHTIRSRDDMLGKMQTHPGFILSYDFSPMRVKIVESGMTIMQLVTQLCAILGGVFTITSILDASVYRAQELVGKQD